MHDHQLDFLGKLPRDCYLAVSGGADSMAILDFFMRSRRSITVLHYNHGTEHGAAAEKFVVRYCRERNISCIVGNISDFRNRNKCESPEMYWREARYNFFSQFIDKPIVTGHNLSDQVESHLFYCMRDGFSRLIRYKRTLESGSNIIRPFLLTPKDNLKRWCLKNQISWIEDPGNEDPKYNRSFIRKEIVPLSLKVNPGIFKMVRRRVIEEYKKDFC